MGFACNGMSPFGGAFPFRHVMYGVLLQPALI